MDFEKEARETIAPLFNQPHPFQEEWSPMHSMSMDDLIKSITQALRKAYLSGQESMRERASLLPLYLASAQPEERLILQDAIRSLPLQSNDEKELG